MTQTLRPMGLGEILDRTIQIYRGRFWAYFGVALVPVALMEMLQAVDNRWIHLRTLVTPYRQPGIFLWSFLVGLGFYHVSSIVSKTIEPAIVKLTGSTVLGETCSLWPSIRFVGRRWTTYFGVALAKTLMELVIPEVTVTLLGVATLLIADFTGSLDQSGTLVATFVVIAWVLLGGGLFLWLGACFSLAIPIAAMEGSGGFRCLWRSWRLSRGSRARVWFTWVTIFLALWIVTFGMEYALGQLMLLMGSVLHQAMLMRELYRPVVFVLATAIYGVLGPIYPIAVTLFYYDQRIRLEGFDIERMMAAAGLDGVVAADAGTEEAVVVREGEG